MWLWGYVAMWPCGYVAMWHAQRIADEFAPNSCRFGELTLNYWRNSCQANARADGKDVLWRCRCWSCPCYIFSWDQCSTELSLDCIKTFDKYNKRVIGDTQKIQTGLLRILNIFVNKTFDFREDILILLLGGLSDILGGSSKIIRWRITNFRELLMDSPYRFHGSPYRLAGSPYRFPL